jgi:FkbM family methyltransferase
MPPKRKLFAVYRWMFKTALNGMGFNNWEDMEGSGELWAIRHLLPMLIKNPRPVMLDVGAHHGEYCNLLTKTFPQAVVHAFEPHPRTFASLEKQAAPTVKLHACALGAIAGMAELFDRKSQDGSVHASLSKESLLTTYHSDVIVHQVRAITLDQFIDDEKIERLDFIKIDTEGFEMDVLNGASRCLEAGRIGVIQFEFNSMNATRRLFLDQFIQRLPDHRLYRLLADGMVALDNLKLVEREIFTFQNIVAIPRYIAPEKV